MPFPEVTLAVRARYVSRVVVTPLHNAYVVLYRNGLVMIPAYMEIHFLPADGTGPILPYKHLQKINFFNQYLPLWGEVLVFALASLPLPGFLKSEALGML